jgi:hypothetical protein
MCRHDDRPSARVQIPENLPQVEARLWIEADRRLVQENDIGLVHERPHDHEALLLAARELRHCRFFFFRKPESFQQLVRALSRHGPGDSEISRVELQILDDVEAQISVGALRNHTNPLSHFD